MSTTAVPNFMVNPQPPAASTITTELANKADISNVRNRIKNLFLTSRTDLVNSPNLSYTSGDIDCNNNNRLLNLFNGWDETNRKNFPAKATNTWALIAQIGSYMYNYLEGSDTFSNAGTLVQTMIDEKGRVYARRKEGGTWYDWYQQGAQEDSSSIGQNGWIRFANGLQISWGVVNVPNDNTGHATVTFTKAFANAPRIFSNVSYVGQYSTSVSCTQTGSRSTTGFDMFVNKIKDGAYSVDWGNICWLAIGNWK